MITNIYTYVFYVLQDCYNMDNNHETTATKSEGKTKFI